MLEPTGSQRARFGPFELDLRSGELTNNGRRQTLPEQPLALLKALLERPGALVTRDELRHQLWPGDTFVDFEHGLNAAVKRLRDALGDSAESPRFIETVPRRGYRFVAPVEGNGQPAAVATAPAAATTPVVPSRGRRNWLWAGALVGLALIVAVAAWRVRSVRPDPPMRLVELARMTGHAMWPTFSPDGTQVAFAWQPEGQDNFDIYVKMIGLEDIRRLTFDPANEAYPSWSPDGRQIAFVRLGPQHGQIHLVSTIGGAERRLSDFPVQWAPTGWSPDGRYLTALGPSQPGGDAGATRVYAIPASGGVPRPLTPSAGEMGAFSVSADGRRLAYVSCQGGCSLNVLGLDREFSVTSSPNVVLPHVSSQIWGIAWSRDGTSVIYSSNMEAGTNSLWRVPVDGGKPPEHIAAAGDGASWPATTSSSDRLVFSRDLSGDVPYRFDAERPDRPLLTSSLIEGQLDFSPDDQRIAYCARSGEAMEVWVAGADGSSPQQLTHGPGQWQCSPHWSPDGRQIAFDSEGADYQWRIWTSAVDGGVPHQVTSDSGNVPTWSRDGQSIYYTGGSGDIWRIRLADGRKRRVTYEGGAVLAHETADGKNLLYTQSGALRRIPVAGGASREILPCVAAWAVSNTPPGIYYAECSAAGWCVSSNPALHRVDPLTGRDQVLGTLDKFLARGLSDLAVSSDGKLVAYNHMLREGHDLVLIENFK